MDLAPPSPKGKCLPLRSMVTTPLSQNHGKFIHQWALVARTGKPVSSPEPRRHASKGSSAIPLHGAGTAGTALPGHLKIKGWARTWGTNQITEQVAAEEVEVCFA